ncbi:uncharacterized protein LOC115739464 [Rhodamnia argentea]|uniref:Uncharacterized protein LOC115739464 n=1 Tax=Rhodamnia argentea TaxID=178133 RepID=A0A8B8P0S5_9MYRT|nr:uncharacterized protein LOC115739464 [Rhodamnia argentea]
MEVLVLSMLGLGMHPVMPLSFVHHIMTRLNARCWEPTHWEFLRRYERLLVAAVSCKRKKTEADSRQLPYLPSILGSSNLTHRLSPISLTDSLVVGVSGSLTASKV